MCSLSCSCLLLRLKFLLFTWCFFFQSWVVLLKLHNILYSCDFIYYTHILKVFFFLLLSGVCKHSSFIHSSLWALFLFSRRQMLLCYIDCVNFHRHLWCLTNVIMHYSLSSQCIWSNKFCLWVFFFYSMKGWGWGEGSLSACFGDMGSRQTLASCVHLSCRSFDMIFSLWIMLNIKHQYWVKKSDSSLYKKKKKYLQVIASNAKPTAVEPCYNEVTSNIKIPSL